MAQPAQKPSSSKLEHQRLCWHYGDLVSYGFRRLRSKYHSRTAELPDLTYIENALAALSLDTVQTQEALANQLQSSLLPLLQGQIETLFQVLDPAGLRNQPRPKLSLVLQTQAELDDSLDQIKYLTATLCPDPATQPHRTDDHGLKRFKSCRLYRLKANVELVLPWRMCEIFEAADKLIQKMELSSAPSIPGSPEIESLDKSLHVAVLGALDTIKKMANCLQASELVIAQDLWKSSRLAIENQLQSIIENLNLSMINRLNLEQALKEKFLGQSVIQLAKLTLPIFKLSKIFFSKVSKRGLAQERLPIHTEISSQQVDILAVSADLVAEDLQQLKILLESANQRTGEATSAKFIKIAKSLQTGFETPLFLILMYFIPLIPDTDGLHRQKYYQNWCVTWNNQMALAIHNFTLAAASFTNDLP
ncbi:hypothetical protein PGT21_015252 [Puccinia graminis f. sp. tritici]|uniref:Uncharacterized protein n=1 Tax=Puccinia graminis f. sp. tritici TaxID=56615 RepID=A0A5B0RLM8_PUCGR|nr:hypothetical protein PGT21_015252 [Puccinia graminis f. sp. tritici]KAA1126831.1 hypothetical protein PGTUg99_026275 [Puccinia graminis f. sp. tritici]